MNHGLTQEDLKKLSLAFGTYLKNVYLFGSRARGTRRPNSDVDLLVDPDKEFNGLQRQLVLQKLEDLAFPYKVDIVRISELSKNYEAQVLGERALLSSL